MIPIVKKQQPEARKSLMSFHDKLFMENSSVDVKTFYALPYSCYANPEYNKATLEKATANDIISRRLSLTVLFENRAIFLLSNTLKSINSRLDKFNKVNSFDDDDDNYGRSCNSSKDRYISKIYNITDKLQKDMPFVFDVQFYMGEVNGVTAIGLIDITNAICSYCYNYMINGYNDKDNADTDFDIINNIMSDLFKNIYDTVSVLLTEAKDIYYAAGFPQAEINMK